MSRFPGLTEPDYTLESHQMAGGLVLEIADYNRGDLNEKEPFRGS